MQAKFQGKENTTNKPSTVIGTLLERLLKPNRKTKGKEKQTENPLLESSTILLSPPDDVKIPGARNISSTMIYVERHGNCLQALLFACQANYSL